MENNKLQEEPIKFNICGLIVGLVLMGLIAIAVILLIAVIIHI